MFKMSFDFNDRDVANMTYVNAALSAMHLSALKLEDSNGFLAVKTMYHPETQQPAETTRHYGFDQLTFVCSADEGADLHSWQVDTAAFSKEEAPESNVFHDMWCSQHPDRVMRVMTEYSFDNAEAFVVLHHEKAGA